jgi:hypothetical protein
MPSYTPPQTPGVPGSGANGTSGSGGSTGGTNSGGGVQGGVSVALITHRTLVLLRLARRATAKPIWRSYLPEVPPA